MNGFDDHWPFAFETEGCGAFCWWVPTGLEIRNCDTDYTPTFPLPTSTDTQTIPQFCLFVFLVLYRYL